MKRAQKAIKVKKDINYSDYNIILDDLYLLELRKLAVHHQLHTSGTKKILIQRIESYLSRIRSSIMIQKTVRAHFLRHMHKIFLSSSKIRDRCVNEVDFYTLEPLKNIPYYLFFEFTDESNFSYGFNIESLIHLYIKTGKIVNPYNRSKILMDVMFKLFTTYGLLRIFFLKQIDSSINLRLPNNFTFSMTNANGIYLNDNVNTFPPYMNDDIVDSIESYSETEFDMMQLLPLQQRSSINLSIMNDVLLNIRQGIDLIRQQPLERRVIEVFMEIDQLGHYTNSMWLFSLPINDLQLFILSIREIWIYRANILDDIKFRIYPFGDPFDNIDYDSHTVRNNVLNSCITIIESFVLSSPNIDDRKLGTLLILSALTRVSYAARRQLPWLYDSFEWD